MAKTMTPKTSAKKTSAAAKPVRKKEVAKASAPEAPKENRYLRAARVIIEFGTGAEPSAVDLDELAVRAAMSPATAGHCWSAFQGICAALRDAGLMKRPAAPAKQPVAPAACTIAEMPPAEPTPDPR